MKEAFSLLFLWPAKGKFFFLLKNSFKENTVSFETQSFTGLAKDLDAFLKEHLPLARAAGVEIDGYDGDCLQVSAPLALNINDKLTAFGGSLYNLCVIAAWGMTDLKAKELKFTGDIVVAKGEITYLKPLRSRLIAQAFTPDKAMIEKAIHSYHAKGKAVFIISAQILDEQQQVCVEFQGKYAVLASI
jgi:thioesterase domain-containing protein